MHSVTKVFEVLLEAAQGLELQGDKFRANAYYNAIDALRMAHRTRSITTMAYPDLLKLPGVGKSIAASVEEILETGTCSRVEELRSQGVPSVSTLLNVNGLGPATARELWKQYNITHIKALMKALKDGTISDPVLQRRLSKAFAMAERIPHEVMLKGILPYFKKLRSLPMVSKAEVAGSLRRKAPDCKDADIMLCIRKNQATIRALTAECGKIFDRPVSGGDSRLKTFITILGKDYQVDLLLVEEDCWGAALNHFTGSAQHNIWMRQKAQEMGLKVNEYGIWKGTKKLGGREERDLFRILDIPYLPPERRTGGPYHFVN